MSLHSVTADVLQVPLLPSSVSDSKSRLLPYVFKGGANSQALNQAMERLACPVEGAVFIEKLVKANSKAAAAAASASGKKRPRAPELEETTAPKKAAKAKAKAKGKAKAAGKAKAGKQGALQDGETLETLQSDVLMEMHEGFRPRLWFDDLLSAVTACKVAIPRPGDFHSTEARLYSTMLGYGLELACTGSIALNKKTLNCWSKATAVKNHK